MRTLSRRFLASYLATLAACVGGCLLALAIVDMLVDFDAIVEGGGTALGALLARVPERWLGEAVPLSSFAAAFLAVAIPARRGEILGVCAAGIHPARVTLPILAAALAVGAAATALPVPEASRERDRSPPAGRAASGSGWILAGGDLVRIGHGASLGGELRDLHWFETDPGFRLRRSLHAEAARIDGDRWELRAARELRFDPDLPSAAPRPAPGPTWIPAPGADPASRRAASSPRSALFGDVATAAAPLLAVLAIPIGLRVPAAGSLAGPALLALVLAASFRGLGQGAAFAADHGILAPAHAAGILLALLATAAAVFWTRALR